jgi:DNA polymerase bacteriophage-type
LILHLDFETRSVLNLTTCGLDRYSKKAEVLLLGWAFDDDEVELWEPRLGPMPSELCRALRSDCELAAWNSAFERSILAHVLNIHIPYERFQDPSCWARHLSLPGGLQSVGDILGLGDGGKDKEGKRLIKLFCEPISLGGEMTLFGVTEPYFAEPEKHPEDWEKFKNYCRQDVRVEREIGHLLEPFKLPEIEKKIWYLDQKINDTGLPVNRRFVEKALKLATRSKQELAAVLKEKTGLENPNSRDQMLGWLGGQGYQYNSLEKASVQAALNGGRLTDLGREVLLTRKEASKTSYKKFEAILDRLGDDDRLRHQYLYLGAARSGRWSAGRGGMQIQNMPRPTKEVENNLDETLAYINNEDYDLLKAAHPSVITAVSSCTRSAFQAPSGQKIIVCDLSAIENRVLGWMAGCDAILDVFRTGRDPYISFAVKMYNQPYDVLLHDKAKRQIAKPAVLGAGYGLGPGVEKLCRECGRRFGYKNYCPKCKCNEFTFEIIVAENKYGDTVKTGLIGYAEAMGVKMTAQQAYHSWYTFRQSYPEVVQLWKNLDSAAKSVLIDGGEVQVGVVTFSRVEWKDQFILKILLPSGRALHYWNARIKTRYSVGRDGEPYEKEAIEYYGIGHGVGAVSKEEGGQGANFGPVWTSGPKLCENLDQAISRDIFAHGMLLADEVGAQIIGHSHDECLDLADDNSLDFGLDDLRDCMSVTPDWATGLPLAAEGFESQVYRKG